MMFLRVLTYRCEGVDIPKGVGQIQEKWKARLTLERETKGGETAAAEGRTERGRGKMNRGGDGTSMKEAVGQGTSRGNRESGSKPEDITGSEHS